MTKAKNYFLLGMMGLAAATGAYLASYIFDPKPSPQKTEREEVRSPDLTERVSTPLNAPYQKTDTNRETNITNPVNASYTLKDLEKILRENPSTIYGVLTKEFEDNLDGLLHYGGEDHFKGKFADLRDIPADYLLSKLNSLEESKRQGLIATYGNVIDSLKGHSSNLEQIASLKGYMKGNATADMLWEEIKLSWGQSKLGMVFVDVFDNNNLAPKDLDAFLLATNAYCNSVGKNERFSSIEGKVREYQASMAECDKLQRKANSGQELTQREQEKMQSWVRTLGDLEAEFGEVTSQSTASAISEVNKRIATKLRSVNPLYGLAFEVVGLE